MRVRVPPSALSSRHPKNEALLAQAPKGNGGFKLADQSWWLIGGAIALLLGIFMLIIFFSFIQLWIQSLL